MFKLANVMFLYTETSLHCGSGTSLGVIDLPIQRERYTDYPVLQASGIKGAMRDWFETKDKRDGHAAKNKIRVVFGPDFTRGPDFKENTDAFAGAATFTDGRLLLFPIRSLKGVFAYATSRLALNRFRRDLEMVKNADGSKTIKWMVPEDSGNTALGIAGTNLQEGGKVNLEEYVFDLKVDDQVINIADWLSANAFPKGNEYKFWREKIKRDLLILPDDVFRDFAKLSTEVQARIKIDNTTKTAAKGALFYEEALHPDSLIYSVVMAQDPACESDKRPDGMNEAKEVMGFISSINDNRAQFGGDATIGRGIVSVSLLNGGGAKQ